MSRLILTPDRKQFKMFFRLRSRFMVGELMVVAHPTAMSRRSFLTLGAAACSVPLYAFAGQDRSKIVLKVSVDTAANHVRNVALNMFADRLATGSRGRLEATVFPSAQLAKDRDVVKSFHWGLVDIGVPAVSKMTRFDTNANLFTLPMFYGSDLRTIYEINDGPIGKALSQQMEQKTETRIFGRSIDLGYTNLYTIDRQVRSVDDITGLRIRVPGSRASLELYKIFDGNPVVMAWGDVAIAVSQGNIDAVQTTHETIRSARLWESGIRYCYEERSSFLGYVPLISSRTWDSLSDAQQKLVSSSWEGIVDQVRLLAHERQQTARNDLLSNGIKIIRKTEALRPAVRKTLFRRSLDLAKELHMDLELVTAAMDVLRAADSEGTG